MLNYLRNNDDKHEICLVNNPYFDLNNDTIVDVGPLFQNLNWGLDSDFKHVAKKLDDFIEFLNVEMTFQDGVNETEHELLKDYTTLLYLIRDAFQRIGQSQHKELDDKAHVRFLEKKVVRKTVEKLITEVVPEGGSLWETLNEFEEFVKTKYNKEKPQPTNA